MLGSFCYLQIYNLLITREKEVLAQSLHQAANTLEYKFNSYFSVIDHIIWDKNLKEALASDYDNNYDMYLAYREVIDPLFLTPRSLYEEIDRITVYSDNNINPHGNILRPLSNIQGFEWFNNILKTTKPHIIVSAPNKQLGVVSPLYIPHSHYTNVIYLNINYAHVFESLSTLFDDSYGIIIVDDKQQPIYEFASFFSNQSAYELSSKQFLEGLAKNTLAKDYIFETTALSNAKWTAYLYRPIETVAAATSRIITIVFLIIIICIVIVLLASYWLSKLIVRPLEELALNMEQVESGDLSVTVRQNSTDEIGHLIQRFGDMVAKLKYLIDEVYKSKIAEQEYEMKALQAQINPHFFYNSLSLINSKAIMSDQEDISLMAQFLSTFYRTTLNKGKSTVLVKDEWRNMTSYIQIQDIMHAHSFDISYDIDHNILNYTMLNLLLQPLVENAIDHGLDHKESAGRGLLTITGKESNDELLFTVSDNGCGIGLDTLKTILTTETSGYGVLNVHRRVQLYYGTQYGLSYSSTLGKGTTVCLTIPKNISLEKHRAKLPANEKV